MTYVSVVPDISTRAVDGVFTYAVPDSLKGQVSVGVTVRMPFSGRPAIGYVVDVLEGRPSDIDVRRIREVEQVLADSAFDAIGAQLALWMAEEYACTRADALRVMLAPGQRPHMRRSKVDGSWELVSDTSGPVDDRWVRLRNEGEGYEPDARAIRQREIMQALSNGPVRLAELRAMIPGISSVVKALEKRGVVELFDKRRLRTDEVTTLSSAFAPRPENLTDGQKHALEAIDRARASGRGDVVLVDGVTGSGKTEVYLRAIESTLADGKGAIVLVPEISLTAQTVGRFRARFGESVAVLHSRLSSGERYDQWDLVRMGTARVVVGARSALFAPISNVGLIVIDEEHEGSYKQDGAPRYHAREVSARLAQLRGSALVLGSATPSLESLVRCREGSWRESSWTHVSMPERPAGSTLPEIHVVDMASEFRGGGRSVFSRELKESLVEVVQKKQKAVLLLNRRGFASFLMCRECGCVPECPHCSCALTYHERTRTLACHTCGRSWAARSWPDPSTACPNCGSRYMGAFGIGTQRVEDEVMLLLRDEGLLDAGVEVIRMDADTTRGKGGHQKLLERFDRAECAVLVGTQMIAKGLDFPEVTLVGVVNADTTLKLPDFRAAERTYALLEQVAGRAGRGSQSGKVVVQTYWASHAAIQAVALHDRELFLDADLMQRREGGYPPYKRLANVIVWGVNAVDVKKAVGDIADAIRKSTEGRPDWEILGPADCIKARVKDRVRKHIVLKVPSYEPVGNILRTCVEEADKREGVSVAIDVDAYDMM